MWYEVPECHVTCTSYSVWLGNMLHALHRSLGLFFSNCLYDLIQSDTVAHPVRGESIWASQLTLHHDPPPHRGLHNGGWSMEGLCWRAWGLSELQWTSVACGSTDLNSLQYLKAQAGQEIEHMLLCAPRIYVSCSVTDTDVLYISFRFKMATCLRSGWKVAAQTLMSAVSLNENSTFKVSPP